MDDVDIPDPNLDEEQTEQPAKKSVVNKLVLLGDTFVGKTSLAYRFVNNKFTENQESTVGAVFMSRALDIGDYRVKFDIWDTAGQERYRSLAPMYYKGAKAALVVYDITSSDSFKRAKEWVSELQQNAGSQIVIAFVGNKIDLNEKRQVQPQEAQDYCKAAGLFHFETSAKTGENLTEIFVDIGNIAKRIPQAAAQTNSGESLKKLDKNTQENTEGRGCGVCF